MQVDIATRIREFFEDALERKDFVDVDDFFELGGDSLGVIAVLHRIEEELNVDVSPSDFFDNPTVERLSSTVAGLRGSKDVLDT